MARDLIKIEDFPEIMDGQKQGPRVGFCGLVVRFYPSRRDYIGMDVTDFTSHPRVCQNQEYYNGGLLLARNELLTIPVKIEALKRIQVSYPGIFGEQYNLAEEYYSASGVLDVHDKLLVVKMTLRTRLYQGFYEPYSYDQEIVDYEYLGNKDRLVVDDLFRNIVSRKEYFSKVSHLAPRLMPAKFLISTGHSSEVSDKVQHLNAISSVPDTKIKSPPHNSQYIHPPDPNTISSSPTQNLVPDIEHGDFDFCNSSTVGSPEEEQVFTISELKQLDTTIDNKTYMVSCKIIGCFPDDWMYLSGKEMDPKSNTAKDPIIRDLEWIIADANVDERTVLNSENTLSVILPAQDILEFSNYGSVEDFFIGCSGYRKKLNSIFNIPTKLEVRKIEIPINSSTTTVVWSPVESK